MFWYNGLTRRNEHRLLLLVTVLLSAIILPPVPIHPSLPSIRFEEMLLFGICGLNAAISLGIFLKSRGKKQTEQMLLRGQTEYKIIAAIFALLLISFLISNFYGVRILKAGYFGLRDLMDPVIFLKYFLVITLTLSIEFREAETDFLRKAFLAGVALLVVFGWVQHLNPLNINTWLSPYFDQQHWELLIVGNPARVQGTFDNPNYFGLFTVISLGYLTARYFFGPDGDKFPWGLLILIGLVIKLEFLTISRTALFGIALLFCILSVWAFLYHSRKKKAAVKILVLLLITVLLCFTASGDFLYRVNEGMDFSSSTSFQGHIERWGKAVGSIWQSPVFGWGTQKYVMTTLVDNEYALYARRYGFFGLAVYLSLFLVPWVLAVRKLRRGSAGREAAGRAPAGIQAARSRKESKAFDQKAQFLAAYIAVLPSVFVFNFMAGIFYNLQLMTVFAAGIGLVYNSLREKWSD